MAQVLSLYGETEAQLLQKVSKEDAGVYRGPLFKKEENKGQLTKSLI